MNDRAVPVRSDDVEAAEWLRERLSGPSESIVSSWIPNGFEAYARILHCAQPSSSSQSSVRWRDVAAWSGVAMHDLIQWCEVAIPEITPLGSPPWRGQGPREGSLDDDDGRALVEVLMEFTPSNDGYFGFWEGYGGGGVTYSTPGSHVVRPSAPGSSHPVVQLPWRSYELFEGPLESAGGFRLASHPHAQLPNLWWPKDHSWCVASEIDLEWTYVAGSRALIARILSDPQLEALPASPSDPLSVAISGWLADVIDRAADEVLATGSTMLDLSLGSVVANWQGSRRRGKGVLSTRSYRWNAWSGGGTKINTRDPEQLREQVRFAIERAVVAVAKC